MIAGMVRDAVRSVHELLPSLPEGWTPVDVLKLVFGLSLIVVAALTFYAIFPNRKPIYKGDKDKKGRPHGRGELINVNGDTYVGDFREGKPHGSGVWTFKKNGCQYRGQFFFSQYHGQGTETYENGSKYEGAFEGGMRHGVGRMTFKDGSWYFGQWVAGKRSGKGTHFDKTEQARYVGEFKAGLRHGKGVLHLRYRERTVGVWDHGQLVKDRALAADTLAPPGSAPTASAAAATDDAPLSAAAVAALDAELSATSAADKRMREELRSAQSAAAEADRSAEATRQALGK